MASALGIPAHGVCTLDALALRAVRRTPSSPEGDFLVATDARRREVYWAAYEQRPDGSVGACRNGCTAPTVSRPDDVPVAGRPVVGRGADLYPDAAGPVGRARSTRPPRRWPHLAVQLLDTGADLSDLSPRYLRRPDVHEGGPRKTVLS